MAVGDNVVYGVVLCLWCGVCVVKCQTQYVRVSMVCIVVLDNVSVFKCVLCKVLACASKCV